MARVIHESIAGINLFVPAAYDFFQIIPTGMPNGEPCLAVKAGDARAFAPVPTLAKDIFNKGGQGPWALSFWTKTTNISNNKEFRFGVQTLNAGGAGSLDHPLSVVINTHIAGLNYLALTIMGTASQLFANPPSANNNWQFFVFNINAPGSMSTYYHNNDGALTNLANTTAGTPNYNANQFFYIGRYGDSAPSANVDNDKYIGKICFHNRMLTLAECQSMYLEMTT